MNGVHYAQLRQYVVTRERTMQRSSTGMLFASWFGVSQDGDVGLTDVTSTYTKQKQSIQNPQKI